MRRNRSACDCETGAPRLRDRGVCCVRLVAAIVLLVLATGQARSQLQVDIFSTNQANSNPNQVAKSDGQSGGTGDYLGQHGVWLGYRIGLGDNSRLFPSYSVGLTLWGSQTEQNLIQHSPAISFKQSDLKLFGYREPVAGVSDNDILAGDTAKAALVRRLDAIADLLDSTAFTRRDAASTFDERLAAEADTLFDALIDSADTGDDLDFLDDELLNGNPPNQADANTNGGLAGSASDSLMLRMVDRLDGLSDSLDVFDGSAELVDQVNQGLRAVAAELRAKLPGDEVAVEAVRRIEALMRDLGRYQPPLSDDELNDDMLDDDDGGLFPNYAPLSVSHQLLLRNIRDDYYFYTGPDDAGADYLRAGVSASLVRYLSTTDTNLLQYNNTGINASVLLEQRLSKQWSMWGGYTLATARYPNASVFNSTQHEFAVQFRYVPNPNALVAFDAGYGVKNYIEEPPTVSGSSQITRVTAEGLTTTLATIGVGGFIRPGTSTVLGAVLGAQFTPTLNPRMTIGFSGGQVGVLDNSGTNLTNDMYGWNGPALQLLVLQALPWELMAGAHVVLESRDYGRPIVSIGGRSIELKDRTDKHATIELHLDREFTLNAAATSFLTVGLTLGTVRNNSTNYTGPGGRSLPSNDFKESYGELALSWMPF